MSRKVVSFAFCNVQKLYGWFFVTVSTNLTDFLIINWVHVFSSHFSTHYIIVQVIMPSRFNDLEYRSVVYTLKLKSGSVKIGVCGSSYEYKTTYFALMIGFDSIGSKYELHYTVKRNVA